MLLRRAVKESLNYCRQSSSLLREDHWKEVFSPTPLNLPEDGAPMLSDLEIAQAAKLKPVTTIAAELGIPADNLHQFGPHMAKVKLAADTVAGVGARGKYIVVTGISPTKFGEGKTTTTLGNRTGTHLTRQSPGDRLFYDRARKA